MEATSHRAVGSFSASSVLPGGRLEVTITPTGYGSLGQVVETLPSGFSYTRSSLAASQVAVEGRTVTFTLLGESDFRYTVTAPSAEGSYTFSGVIKDVNRAAASVSGASTIRVGPPPNADAYTHADTHADTLGSGIGRGGRHAKRVDRCGGCWGSPTSNRRRGVSEDLHLTVSVADEGQGGAGGVAAAPVQEIHPCRGGQRWARGQWVRVSASPSARG